MADAPGLNPDAPAFCPNFAGYANHNETNRGRGRRGRGRREGGGGGGGGGQRSGRGRYNGSGPNWSGQNGSSDYPTGSGSDAINNNNNYSGYPGTFADSSGYPDAPGNPGSYSFDPSLPPPCAPYAASQAEGDYGAGGKDVQPGQYPGSFPIGQYSNGASSDPYAGLGDSVYSNEFVTQLISGDSNDLISGQSRGVENSRRNNHSTNDYSTNDYRGSRGARGGGGGGGNDSRRGKRGSQQYQYMPQHDHYQGLQYQQRQTGTELYYQSNQYHEPYPHRENRTDNCGDSARNDVEESDDEGEDDDHQIEKDSSSANKNGPRLPTQAGRAGDQVVDPKNQRGRLVEALCSGTYECLVCCVRIKHEARTWSCGACFNVFHVYCARKWARSPAAAAELPMPPDVGRDDYRRMMGWRCPTCQNVAKDVPNEYFCFCGKVKDPEFDRLETPHSCGEVCGRPRGTGGSLMHASKSTCPHTCTLLCHPGPCPPCTAFVTKACQCGKSKKEVKCSQEQTIQCESECGNLLNCGKHSCDSICHKPPCSKCAIRVDVSCCCGQTTQTHDCNVDLPTTFVCELKCSKQLECGVEGHCCGESCHPGDCGPCPRLPEAVKRCPCGKAALCEIGAKGDAKGGNKKKAPDKESNSIVAQRTSCQDPIPTCGSVCGKALPCGDHKGKRHLCEAECHEGACPPCQKKSNVPCFCGATTRKMDCEEMIKKTSIVEAATAREMLGEDRKFFCDRKCNKKMSCGRHKCGKACCTLRDHVCTEKCGKKLTCRRHQCEEPCHKGNCDTCPNVSFDELSCHCGASVLPPPIHCGTRPPVCSEPCRRVHECSHPVSHNCHSDVKCPPCSALVSRFCMGEHQKRSNIPCYLKDVSCGLPCKKPLPDCDHLCKKSCHKGDCSSAKESSLEPDSATSANGARCSQPCNATRPDCGHPCNTTCHGKNPCPRSICKIQIRVNCKCGRKSKTMACPWGSSKESHQSFQHLTTQALASKFKDIQLGNSIDISDLQSTVSSLKVKNLCFSSSSSPCATPSSASATGGLTPPATPPTVHLECDEDCNAVERNKRFAEALSLENAEYSNKVSAETTSASTYSAFLKEQARKDPKLVSSVEEKIAELVNGVTAAGKQKKTHSFPPMKSHQRQIVHELAEIYGCASVSYDEDPKRNVVVTATKSKASLPPMALTAFVQREKNPRAPVPIPLGSKVEELRSAVAKEKRSTAIPSWATVGTANTSKPPPTDYFDYFDGC